MHQFLNLKYHSMRTTVTIDDELYTQALEVIDPDIEKSELFREALKVLFAWNQPSDWPP